MYINNFLKSKIFPNFEVLNPNYRTDEGSCLDITIFTGRQNQIRAALKTLSLTLLGDKKYAKDNSSFMHLNFYHLSFKTGVLKKKNTFEIKRKFIA